VNLRWVILANIDSASWRCGAGEVNGQDGSGSASSDPAGLRAIGHRAAEDHSFNLSICGLATPPTRPRQEIPADHPYVRNVGFSPSQAIQHARDDRTISLDLDSVFRAAQQCRIQNLLEETEEDLDRPAIVVKQATTSAGTSMRLVRMRSEPSVLGRRA